MSRLMGMLAPLGLAGSSGGISRADDDMADKMNHSYSCFLIIIFAVIVSTKQYVGDPIHCWVPGHFTDNHEAYAQKICWVSNFYYIPIEDRIPLEGENRKWINYYQWIPMFLAVQAALFYAPSMIWKGINTKAGVEIHNLVDSGKSLHDTDNKEKSMRYMVRQMDRYLAHYRDQTPGCCSKAVQRCFRRCSNAMMCGRKHGNYLTIGYIFVKFLYLANALGQLFLMDIFLGTDFHFYGFTMLKGVVRGEDFPGTSRFPRVTMCDYKVRQIGHNIHRNTVQCVLPINFFNEKLFVVIWFWLLFMSIVTGINFIIWVTRIIFRGDRVRWVRRHLRNMAKLEMEDKKYPTRFTREYLRQDGILILRLIAINVGDMVASELTSELYDHYRAHPPVYYKKPLANAPDLDDVDGEMKEKV